MLVLSYHHYDSLLKPDFQDPSLKRCYGVDKKISDCRWDYLSTLMTEREPRQKMPQLKDLLEYMAEPGMEKIWVLLDIKVSWS
jgi:phosphatidylglycerol phospholipase C